MILVSLDVNRQTWRRVLVALLFVGGTAFSQACIILRAWRIWPRIGRTSKVENRKSDMTVISSFEYERDAVGNPVSIQREDGYTVYYEYDAKHQLTAETHVDDGSEIYAWEWDYDAAGNREYEDFNGEVTYYEYNAGNELVSETTGGQTTYYEYDRCGNTTAKQEPTGTTYYHWDHENLMTQLDLPDGSHNYFAYDADSKRVEKRDREGFTEFIYQGPDMLKLQQERDENGDTKAQYTMGNGLEAMRRADGGDITTGDSSFYHFDQLGSTFNLTDETEAVTDTYLYNAWGEVLDRTGTTSNPHTYVGKERYYQARDAMLYLLGLRYYEMSAGRFLSVDPEDRTRRYVYVQNRPAESNDALGLRGSIVPDPWEMIEDEWWWHYWEIRRRLEELRRIPLEVWERLNCAIRMTRKHQGDSPPDYYEGPPDKFTHCNVSCEISRNCSPLESATVGTIREVFGHMPDWIAERLPTPPVPQLVKDVMTNNPEMADMWANYQGWLCADIGASMTCAECCGGCPLPGI